LSYRCKSIDRINLFELKSKESLDEDKSMGREIITTEAITLKVVNHKERGQIISLYSKEEGLLKLYVTLSKKTPFTLRALFTPLVRAEFQLTKGRSDFYRFYDGTLLDQRLSLRTALEKIEIASAMAEAIYKMLWPGQASAPLYHLLDRFLTEVATSSQPQSLLAAFYLKLLQHEGIWQTESACITCRKELIEGYRYKGERYCDKDAPPPAERFSKTEEQLVQQMISLRNFNTLYALQLEEAILEKLTTLFMQNSNS